MPELPDVAGFKKYVENSALHQKISQVIVHDERFVKGCGLDEFREAVEERAFTELSQHGKFLFQSVDAEQWVVLHFGMTGEPWYYKASDQPPRFERVAFCFGSGNRLGIACMRMLGHVSVTSDRDQFIQEAEMGPHALDINFGERDFVSTFSGRRGTVKSALMNQKLVAGIGNIYADEILLQAGIHPKTRVSDLSEQKLKHLYRIMRDVLKTATDVGGKWEQLPAEYLVPLRGRKDVSCPLCGQRVDYTKVSGRGAYVCPSCQK